MTYRPEVTDCQILLTWGGGKGRCAGIAPFDKTHARLRKDGQKPPGMQWRIYERLAEHANEAEAEWMQPIAQRNCPERLEKLPLQTESQLP